MPSKNRIKQYTADAYYHVFNRGVNKQEIFRDSKDFAVFMSLLKRYLSNEPTKDKQGREYPWLQDKVELLAFCMMPNHFHLLIFQNEPDAMSRLLGAVSTSYTMYFNKKYKRIGPLFQDRFKAVLIKSDGYLHHISRYIHLNPTKFEEWEFSSLGFYMGAKHAEWVSPHKILELFNNNPGEYIQFLCDYLGHKKALKVLKSQLADA